MRQSLYQQVVVDLSKRIKAGSSRETRSQVMFGGNFTNVMSQTASIMIPNVVGVVGTSNLIYFNI